MGSAEMHLQDLADELAKPLFILLEKLWQSDEAPALWKRRNITTTFKKGTWELQATPSLCA